MQISLSVEPFNKDSINAAIKFLNGLESSVKAPVIGDTIKVAPKKKATREQKLEVALREESEEFEMVNQQLLMEGFSEMLLVLLPLINWSGLKRLGSRWIRFFKNT